MPPQQSVRAPRSLERFGVWALIATLIAALVIVIPFGSVPFAATKTFVLGAGALITLALYILARLSRGNVILPPMLLVGALWLPVVAYALSMLFSGASGGMALWGSALEPDTVGFMLVAAFLGTLAAFTVRRAEQFRAFLTAAAYAFGAVVVVQALIIIVGQFAPNTVSPALSIVGSSSDLALILGLGVVVSLITLRLIEVSSRTRLCLIIAGAVSLVLLAALNNSLVWVLVALISLGLFVEAVMRRAPGQGTELDLEDTEVVGESDGSMGHGARPLTFPLIVLAISLFFLIGGTLGGAFANALHINVLDVRPSWSSTWNVASHVYGSSPIFGSGPGTFGSEWLKYRDASLNSTVFWSIDFTSGIGFIPTSLVSTGILGLLAWLGLLGLFLWVGFRQLLTRAPEDRFMNFVSVLSFVSAAYLFAGALFGLPSSEVLVLAFVFTGLFASTVRYGAGKTQWGIAFARSPRVGFVIVFSLTLLLLASVAAAYALVERYVANVDLAQANAALSAGNLTTAASAAQNSLAFAQSATAYQIEATVASAQLGQIAASTTMAAADAQKAFQAALSNGINAALTATQIAPNDYQNWLALGGLYAQAVPLKVQGAYDSAKTAYQKAEALAPTNPQIPYALAQLDIANKDTKSAEADLQKAISLKQDYTAAIYLLSELYVQDGNLKDALTSAKAAAYFTPSDPNVLFQVGVLSAASNDLPTAVSALSAAVSVNPQFANARYFLAAVYAKQGDYTDAVTQVQAISAMSADNAKAVASTLASLQANKNPFPANLLAAPTAPTTQAPSTAAGSPAATPAGQ